MARRWIRPTAACLGVCFCAVAASFFNVTPPPLAPSNHAERPSRHLRRSLDLSDRFDRFHSNPITRNHIKPITSTPNPSKETVLFWHIPKSGGTTLKSIYKCMKQTLSVRVGVDPKLGHGRDDELVLVKASGTTFVNVDTITKPGILRAEKMGLVRSGLADLIVTANLNFAVEHLYDNTHKGRVLALFRHPVERLVSKFHYAQVATWENSYKPGWKDMDLQYWAENVNAENNVIVKTLAGLALEDEVSEKDLHVAMRTLSSRFVVGLMHEMEESIHRFNVFMGIDESKEESKKCLDEYFGHGMRKDNSNPHPDVDEASPAGLILYQKNEFDVRLYEYIVQLFEQQREIIKSYASSLDWDD